MTSHDSQSDHQRGDLVSINGAVLPRRDRRGTHRRTPEEIAKMSAAKRAWWAARKANTQQPAIA